MESAPPPLDYASPKRKTWRVGTLVYDRRALLNVFFWMLWGDFCLNLMDSGVQPNVIPLQLKKYGASMSAIGFLTGSVVELMSIVGVVMISTWSDRHRGKLGRRMPFMLYATPPLALCLIALGYSPQIATWLQRTAPGAMGGIALSQLVIAVIAVTMVAYKVFDLFPQSVYYYLFTDVIPQELMGTFACMFRVVSTLGVLVFNWFLLKHAEDAPSEICILAAGLYLFAFVMLCLRVKEGEYPPPPIAQGTLVQRWRDSVTRYTRECFSQAFYWKFYAFTFCFICGFIPFGRFIIFYGQETLRINLTSMGHIFSVRDAVQVSIFFVMGPIIDRVHPIRAALVGYVLMLISAAGGFVLIRNAATFSVGIVVIYASVAVFQGASLALGPRLLPRQQYGQFCSATAMLWHFGLVAAIPLCGKMMDLWGYRLIFAWFAVFSSAGILMTYLVYLDWKKFGGDRAYTPPVVTADPPAGFEVAPDRV